MPVKNSDENLRIPIGKLGYAQFAAGQGVLQTHRHPRHNRRHAGTLRVRLFALVRTEGDVGFMDRARQLADEAAAKAKVAADDAKEKAGPALEQAKAKAAELEEKAKPTIRKADQEMMKLDEKIQPHFDQLVQDGKDLVAKAKEKLK
jgi:polyhydroxyalkanoate synthesis regulator phasin